jgi:drug/metabolite transporter (DMT)-like permease
MIYLLISILASTSIFVTFSLFPRFGINTFQAIVFNYFTACFSGFILYGNEFSSKAIENPSWIPFAILSGILFISLFFVMGISSQKNGVAITSIAVKMSMALSLFLIIIWNKESIGMLKSLGILAAIIGVILVSLPKESGKTKVIVWMLLVLFVGSGILDFELNYVKENHLQHLPASLFSAIGFGIAGIIGVVILLIQILQKKTQFAWKNVLAGIVLGVPNYFSIFFLIVSYTSTGWNDSTVLAITNVSIVLNSAIIGFLIFKESFSVLKLVGLLFSVSAIVLLYLANR